MDQMQFCKVESGPVARQQSKPLLTGKMTTVNLRPGHLTAANQLAEALQEAMSFWKTLQQNTLINIVCQRKSKTQRSFNWTTAVKDRLFVH